MFKRLCIIGIGLIGSSIARASRQQGLCEQIVAYGSEANLQNMHKAKQLNVVDEFYTDIESAVTNADYVVIATPVGAIESVFKLLQPFWNENTVYTDVCSTKGSVIAAAQAVFTELPFNIEIGISQD